MGIVHHANYLVWMEVARVEYCRTAGFRYRDLERDHGILLVVTEANCRYLSPARYDDEIEITTSIAKATRRTLTFEYEMRLAGEESTTPDLHRRIATGITRHVFLNREMHLTSLPAQYRKMLGIPENEIISREPQ
jgi:acyl-CoA thioester hydrolase